MNLKKLATVATVTTLVGAAGVVGVSATPLGASSTPTATTSESPAPRGAEDGKDRQERMMERIRAALQSLVDDTTLTADQADKVATKLAEERPDHKGPRGHHGKGKGKPGGHHLAPPIGEVADILDMSEEDVRAALKEGRAFAAIAEDKGMDRDTLVTKLTEAAKAKLAEAVADGKLTQQRADTMTERLNERISRVVDHVPGERGPRGDREDRGPRGERGN